MIIWFYILIFIISCILLYFSGGWVVGGLMRITRYLGLKEFVVAFFVMAFAASLPNLLLGIFSALDGTPELSFGDVSGNNLIVMTLAVALAILFTKNKEIPAESQIIQATSIFTIIAAILPLILILDGKLSRIDGVLLIALFIFYLSWLFSKKERFTRIYERQEISVIKEFKILIKDLGKLILGIFFVLAAAKGIVESAQFFAQGFNLPLILIGVLITGLGNALPEIYFGITSARKGEIRMILGDLMGSVIILSTLVLGIVALISPIKIADFSPFAIARFFLIFSSLFFLFFVRTGRKISKKEGFILILIYLTFIFFEIINQY